MPPNAKKMPWLLPRTYGWRISVCWIHGIALIDTACASNSLPASVNSDPAQSQAKMQLIATRYSLKQRVSQLDPGMLLMKPGVQTSQCAAARAWCSAMRSSSRSPSSRPTKAQMRIAAMSIQLCGVLSPSPRWPLRTG